MRSSVSSLGFSGSLASRHQREKRGEGEGRRERGGGKRQEREEETCGRTRGRLIFKDTCSLAVLCY